MGKYTIAGAASMLRSKTRNESADAPRISDIRFPLCGCKVALFAPCFPDQKGNVQSPGHEHQRRGKNDHRTDHQDDRQGVNWMTNVRVRSLHDEFCCFVRV